MHQFFCVGEILRPQGVRGEAKVRPYASRMEDFLQWTTLYLEEQGVYRALAARCSRVHDGFAYITLEGCSRPEDVDISTVRMQHRWRKARRISVT